MKCSYCKKTHVVLFTCKCGKPLCLKDRFPDKHECTYIDELFQIEKVVKEKIIKI
jgi:predicted nucleic acid binding AN1-type Zn finger protein